MKQDEVFQSRKTTGKNRSPGFGLVKGRATDDRRQWMAEKADEGMMRGREEKLVEVQWNQKEDQKDGDTGMNNKIPRKLEGQ